MELNSQQKEMIRICQEHFAEGRNTTVSGVAGSGKAQPVDTVIPTPLGMKRMGDLKVGDYVFDRYGKPTKILGIFPQGKIDNYKVTLSNGDCTYCNDEHLWSYYTSRGNLRTITLREMIESGLTRANGFKYKIPCLQNPLEFNIKNELTIDAYVIGAFLGDGCCREKYLILSSDDEEVVQYVAKKINSDYKKQSEFNYSWKFGNIKTKDFLPKELCCYSYEKRIPKEYKYSSIEDRYKLIQGMMDTDGSITFNEGRYNCRFTSASKGLIDDFREVLSSLGYNSSISIDGREDRRTCYNVNILIPNSEKHKLFRLKRKKDIALSAINKRARRDYEKISIVSIEKQKEQKEMVCIYVDNDEHLYLTNDCIVTHNTTCVSVLIEKLGLDLENEVVYLAPTGKAAQVLRGKGLPAITAHKFVFRSFQTADGTYGRMKKTEMPEGIKLIVVDESSMLSKRELDILLELTEKAKTPIIFLGDHMQLPPLFGSNGIMDEPDVILTKVERQKEGCLLDFINEVREGNDITDCINFTTELSDELLMDGDVIVCGTNKTRQFINSRIREYKGYDSVVPNPGEKLVCKTNNWDFEEPLVNGLILEVLEAHESQVQGNGDKTLKVIIATLRSETGFVYEDVMIDYRNLEDESEQPFTAWSDRPTAKFAWGYCITVHASQGSQWDRVIVVEEKFPYAKAIHQKHLYTAVSRAIHQCVVCRIY